MSKPVFKQKAIALMLLIVIIRKLVQLLLLICMVNHPYILSKKVNILKRYCLLSDNEFLDSSEDITPCKLFAKTFDLKY